MPPRRHERARNRLRTIIVNPDARGEQEQSLYDRVAQKLIDGLSREPEKKIWNRKTQRATELLEP